MRLIAGWSLEKDGTQRAVLWSGNTITRLPLPAGYSSSQANGINDNGDVVGQSGGHGVLWRNGLLIDLGAVFYASDINNVGQVVGSLNPVSSQQHAFLWDDLSGLRDLNDLLPAGDRYDPLTGNGWVL